jgi:hypothetical protein
VEDITQCQHSLELEVLIDNHETVDPGFADSVEDGIQTIIQRASVDPRELLKTQ